MYSSFRRRVFLLTLSISFLFLASVAYLVNSRHLEDILLKSVPELFISVIALVLLITISLSLLFYWALTPVKRLLNEIEQIQECRQEWIEGDYPVELHATVNAFNRLLHQTKQQEQRYKNALSDLAHSLKTRIAASYLLIGESGLENSPAIREQLNEMDLVVQYQLRRATLGAKGLVNHKTSLEAVLDKLESLFSRVHRNKNILLKRHFFSSITLPVEEDDLVELLGNILENAYRYAEKEISVTVDVEVKGYLVEVYNDGPAIDKTKVEQLFSRGVRADEINPGTGLGLAICREIAQSYQGDIWFETDSTSGISPEKGVYLKLFLPFRNA